MFQKISHKNQLQVNTFQFYYTIQVYCTKIFLLFIIPAKGIIPGQLGYLLKSLCYNDNGQISHQLLSGNGSICGDKLFVSFKVFLSP